MARDIVLMAMDRVRPGHGESVALGHGESVALGRDEFEKPDHDDGGGPPGRETANGNR